MPEDAPASYEGRLPWTLPLPPASLLHRVSSAAGDVVALHTCHMHSSLPAGPSPGEINSPSRTAGPAPAHSVSFEEKRRPPTIQEEPTELKSE